jgi:hypothetical protein
LVAGFVIYTRTPYRRLATLARNLPTREKLKAGLLVPVIRVAGDVAKMIGYPVGLVWRVKNKPPKWK